MYLLCRLAPAKRSKNTFPVKIYNTGYTIIYCKYLQELLYSKYYFSSISPVLFQSVSILPTRPSSFCYIKDSLIYYCFLCWSGLSLIMFDQLLLPLMRLLGQCPFVPLYVHYLGWHWAMFNQLCNFYQLSFQGIIQLSRYLAFFLKGMSQSILAYLLWGIC